MTDGTTVLYLGEGIDGAAILTRPKVTLRFRHTNLLESFFLKRTISKAAATFRHSPRARLRITRTRENTAGSKRSFYGDYREGMDTDEDPSGVYVENNTGQLFFSGSGGG